MTKKEINEKYGIHRNPFTNKANEEIEKELSEEEIESYTEFIKSFINYLQSDLKKEE